MEKLMIVKNGVEKVFGKAIFGVKKNSPEILLATGLVGVVAGAVVACKSTLKVNDILDETKSNLEKINTVATDKKYAEKYTSEDAKKDTAIVYAKAAMKLANLYGPAIAIEAFSIAAIIAGNRIQRKRLVALGMAYATIDKSFKEYRNRVVEKYGEDEDKNFKYGLKTMKIEEIVKDEATGKDKKVKNNHLVADENLHSEYATYFDHRSLDYDHNIDYNMMFLSAQQAYINNKLVSRGHVFLNEVMDDLGLPRSKAGQIVGWVYDSEDGDSYVDLRVQLVDCIGADGRPFTNIIIDPNVQGNVLDLI